MSEPVNNENLNGDESNLNKAQETETSTVFSAPAAHNDDVKKNKNSRALKISLGIFAVAVLGFAVFAVVKWMPEKPKEIVSQIETKNAFSVDSDKIESVVIKNQKAELIIKAKNVSTDISSSPNIKKEWILEGYDASVIDSASLEQLVKGAASLDYYTEYSSENLADYSLDSPEITVTVKGDGINEYTVGFGKNTTDDSRCYAFVSDKEGKVYVVADSSKQKFNLTPLDLAISTGIPEVKRTAENGKYFNKEGKLDSFDSITLSGSKFKNPIVFEPNNKGAFTSYAPFITTAPQKRVADGVDELLKLFANSTSSSACVSFDQSESSLKKFGLDKPEIVVTMKLAGETYTYKITAQEGTNSSFFVAASNDPLIRAVPITNLPFANKEEKDFYTLFIVLEEFADISRFELAGEVNAVFDIAYDEDNEVYNISSGDKKADPEKFQSAYADFISTTGIDISVVPANAKTSLTIKIHHKDESPATVVSFRRVSETRYQYYVGGTAMGQITSTAYKNIVRDFSSF